MSGALSEILVLEEWDIGSVTRIPEGYEELALGNRAGKEVDQDALTGELAGLAGIECIKRLVIKSTSSLRDVRVVRAFPALEELRLHGDKIRTLDGLRGFVGRSLHIDMAKNRGRDIGRIDEARIERLSLRYANPDDVEAIARCAHLGELMLVSCPPLALDRWHGVPIQRMQLWGGTIDVLRDTRHLRQLRTLTLHDCRSLQAFAGGNDNVTWMIIQVCNRLDLLTVRSFGGLAHLTIRGSKNGVPLSILDGLAELQTLSLLNCRVRLDRMDLNRSAPQLQKLVVEKMTKEEVATLGAANPSISIRSTTWAYRSGVLVKRSLSTELD